MNNLGINDKSDHDFSGVIDTGETFFTPIVDISEIMLYLCR
jgi:hypothetical protein